MFILEKNGIINFGNIVNLTINKFKTIEPEYPSLPDGYFIRYYIPNELHEISGPGKITISQSVEWKEGNRYISRINDFLLFKKIYVFEEHSEDKIIKQELDKKRPYYDLRKEEYPSIEQLIVSLWEYIIEGKSEEESGIIKLKELRNLVKSKYPKVESK